MKVVKKKRLRKNVYDMLGRYPKNEALHHFLKEKVPRSTMYSIYKRFKNGAVSTGIKKKVRRKKFTAAELVKFKKSAVIQIWASNPENFAFPWKQCTKTYSK